MRKIKKKSGKDKINEENKENKWGNTGENGKISVKLGQLG